MSFTDGDLKRLHDAELGKWVPALIARLEAAEQRVKEERAQRYLVERQAAIKGLALADIKRMADRQIGKSLPTEERFCLDAIRYEASKALQESEKAIHEWRKAAGK